MHRSHDIDPQTEVVVLTGGRDAAATTCQGSAAAQGASVATQVGRAAADPRELGRVDQARPGAWPDWAREQLEQAVEIARAAQASGERQHLAATLYREWFYPSIGRPGELLRAGRPLAGLYRSAHAGSDRQRAAEEYQVVLRHDVIGRDGWWRTWGAAWTPPRSRPGSVRLLMSPRPDQLGALVTAITTALLDSPDSWLLACATDPRRLRRSGSIVLDIPTLDVLEGEVLDAVSPLLRPASPPLCLPIAPGIALAQFPDNGMTFGEHRCHLVALGLRRALEDEPLPAIADVFIAHGIDPAHPYR